MNKGKTYVGVIISEDHERIGKKPIHPELGSLVIVKDDYIGELYMVDDGYYPNSKWSWHFPKHLIEIIEEIQE